MGYLGSSSGGGGGTPGGSDTQLQYNNAGAFGGVSGVTSNGTSLLLTSSLLDDSSNEFISFTKVAAAVNQLDVSNNSTGNPPILAAAGGDTNISIRVAPKGSGIVQLRASAPELDLYNTTGGFTALQLIGSLITSAGGQDLTLRSNGTNLIFADSNSAGHAIFNSTLLDVTFNQKIKLDRTITAGGTTGAQTINKLAGTVNFDTGASSLVVTNSLVDTSSIIFCEVRTNDTTAQIKNVVAAAGSFTIRLAANATAETSVGFFVTN